LGKDIQRIMAIEFGCGKCGYRLKVPDNSAGKRVKCPKCESVQTIPAPGGTPSTTSKPIAGEGVAPAAAAKPPTAQLLPAKPSAARPQAPLAPLAMPVPQAETANFIDAELAAGPSLNPGNPAWGNAAPSSDPEPAFEEEFPRKRKKKTSAKLGSLRAPALGMILMSGFSILVYVSFLGVRCMAAYDYLNTNGPMTDFEGVIFSSSMMGILLGAFTGLIANVIIFRGGWYMIRGINYSLAKRGAIVSAIPVCGILSFPFGIWALILLSNRLVEDQFAS
jgi:phage FluMu protein Com